MKKYIFTIDDLAEKLNRHPVNVSRRISKLAIQGHRKRHGKGLLYSEEHLQQLINYRKVIFNYNDLNRNIFDSEFTELNVIYEDGQFFAIIPSKINLSI